MSDIKAGQYRKRPVVVEAVRFRPGQFTKGEWLAWCPDADIGAPLARDAKGDLIEDSDLDSVDFRWFNVKTLEGTSYEVQDGVWIIKGVENEFYPCQHSVFWATYQHEEPAADDD